MLIKNSVQVTKLNKFAVKYTYIYIYIHIYNIYAYIYIYIYLYICIYVYINYINVYYTDRLATLNFKRLNKF